MYDSAPLTKMPFVVQARYKTCDNVTRLQYEFAVVNQLTPVRVDIFCNTTIYDDLGMFLWAYKEEAIDYANMIYAQYGIVLTGTTPIQG